MAKGPGPLERAAEGDDDALEHVLGSVVGPTFDVALHWHGDGEAASTATVAALAELARAIRSPEVPGDLLTHAVRTTLAGATPGGEPPPVLAQLDDRDRAIVVAGLAGGLGGAGLAAAAGDAEAANKLDDILDALGGREDVQAALDEAGASVSMPEGMIDRALTAAGVDLDQD